MARLTAYERSEALNRAADLLTPRRRSSRARSPWRRASRWPSREARSGAARTCCASSAFEGAQLRGEVLPLDAAVNGAGKLGLAMRVPCGVVVAITPFNFPLLLVLHKVAPALAAGQRGDPQAGQRDAAGRAEADRADARGGAPAARAAVHHRRRLDAGRRLCADPRVRKITFTGSTAVGEQITRVAGIKRLSLELGGNAPLVVLRRRRRRGGRRADGGRRLRQRRSGVHLDPARDRRAPGLRRLPRRAGAAGRRDRDRRPARRRDPAVGDDHRARGRAGSELDRGGRRRRRPRPGRRRARRRGPRRHRGRRRATRRCGSSARSCSAPRSR